MKLEVGDYIRTKKGKIAKIISKEDVSSSLHRKEIVFILDIGDRLAIHSKKVTKSSKNIIDLIEVGDILLIKDFVDEACTIFTDVYYIQNENQLFNIKRDLEKNKNMKISKILTKEQFESMAYEVEQ